MQDLISRQAAIDSLNEKCLMPVWCKVLVKKMLTDLPSAQPEETCDTCDTCTRWHFKNTRYEDWRCECCRMSYHPNYYERRTDE